MEKQIKYLEKAINDSKRKYSNQRRHMFKLVKWYKYPLVLLSALSTIALGLQLGAEYVEMQKNIALVITAGITLLTTLMTSWKVEEYWLQNKVIEQELEILQQKFEYEKTKGISAEKADQIFKELKGILGQQHSYWKGALDDLSDANGD